MSFAYDYMRRTGQVSHDDLKQRDPHFAAACETLQRRANESTTCPCRADHPKDISHEHPTQRPPAAGATALVAVTIAPVAAQTFPARPVRTVLPYSAGSGPDAVVRQVGEKLSREWGQQMLVDNKPGANGWLAAGEVKRAAPDGYTLLTVDATHMTLQPNLYKQMPFDPVKDFEPVAALYSTNFFVVVGANSPWKNLSELLAAAKAKKGQLTYGTWGMGSVAHVGTAMLEARQARR